MELLFTAPIGTMLPLSTLTGTSSVSPACSARPHVASHVFWGSAHVLESCADVHACSVTFRPPGGDVTAAPVYKSYQTPVLS